MSEESERRFSWPSWAFWGMIIAAFIGGMFLLIGKSGGVASQVSNASQATPPVTVQITSPTSNQSVPIPVAVEGVAPSSGTQVWLVVEPLQTTGQCWAWGPDTVGPDYKWKMLVEFGQRGRNQGETFQATAVANPTAPPAQAGPVNCGLNGSARSATINVIRQ